MYKLLLLLLLSRFSRDSLIRKDQCCPPPKLVSPESDAHEGQVSTSGEWKRHVSLILRHCEAGQKCWVLEVE